MCGIEGTLRMEGPEMKKNLCRNINLIALHQRNITKLESGH